MPKPPGRYCQVYSCGVMQSASSVRTFHSFPNEASDKERFDKFVQFCDRPPQPEFQQVGDVLKISAYVAWKPSKASKICGGHFKETAFTSLIGRRRLKDDAVPTEVGEKLRDDWRVTKPELMKVKVNTQMIFCL